MLSTSTLSLCVFPLYVRNGTYRLASKRKQWKEENEPILVYFSVTSVFTHFPDTFSFYPTRWHYYCAHLSVTPWRIRSIITKTANTGLMPKQGWLAFTPCQADFHILLEIFAAWIAAPSLFSLLEMICLTESKWQGLTWKPIITQIKIYLNFWRCAIFCITCKLRTACCIDLPIVR